MFFAKCELRVKRERSNCKQLCFDAGNLRARHRATHAMRGVGAAVHRETLEAPAQGVLADPGRGRAGMAAGLSGATGDTKVTRRAHSVPHRMENAGMHIVVNEDLKAYIDPLTADEHDALQRSLLTEGCRDALVLWGDVLVDGHNRYGICQKHGIPFQTLQSTQFHSLEDVHLWMIDQHLGRRSVSDFQRGVLALRKRAILSGRKQLPQAVADAAPLHALPSGDAAAVVAAADPIQSREGIARAARLSSSQVVMIEKIQKQAAPEVVAAVKSGAISINAAAAVATLPEQEQVAAALGGRDELRQAAKRVRETRKRVKPDAPAAGTQDSVEALQSRIAALEAENADLRQQLARLGA